MGPYDENTAHWGLFSGSANLRVKKDNLGVVGKYSKKRPGRDFQASALAYRRNDMLHDAGVF